MLIWFPWEPEMQLKYFLSQPHENRKNHSKLMERISCLVYFLIICLFKVNIAWVYKNNHQILRELVISSFGSMMVKICGADSALYEQKVPPSAFFGLPFVTNRDSCQYLEGPISALKHHNRNVGVQIEKHSYCCPAEY